MLYHIVLHETKVAVVEAVTPQSAIEMVEKDKSLLGVLSSEYSVHARQDKDLN